MVAGHELEVIGVMKRPADIASRARTTTACVIPYFTMHKLFPTAQENHADGAGQGRQAARGHRRIDASCCARNATCRFDKPDNFFISTADQLVEQFRSVTSMVTLVMVVLSSIGLLVGGIGVMNIMLVSVTERTREIGVRKAIGARRRDIILQFLTEAVVLTGLGGMIGMLFGWLVSMVSPPGVPEPAHAVPLWAVGLGIACQRRHRPVLRHLAGQQGRAAGSGGSAALRIKKKGTDRVACPLFQQPLKRLQYPE